MISITNHALFHARQALMEKADYEENKNFLKYVAPDVAEKLISIIESESEDFSRRSAFLQTTIEEICHGADYSMCKNVDDMSKAYASSIINRLMR